MNEIIKSNKILIFTVAIVLFLISALNGSYAVEIKETNSGLPDLEPAPGFMGWSDGDYCPTINAFAMNNGEYYDVNKLKLAIFIDGKENPSNIHSFEGPWDPESILSDTLKYDDWPDDFGEHTLTLVVDYKENTKVSDYLDGSETGNIEESNELNNVITFTRKDPQGTIIVGLKNYDSSSDSIEITCKGEQNDYVQTITYNWGKVENGFYGIPFGSYNVTIIKNGEEVDSKSGIQVSFEDRIKVYSYTFSKVKPRYNNFINDFIVKFNYLDYYSILQLLLKI